MCRVGMVLWTRKVRVYPAASSKLLRVQPECLICSNLEAVFWLSTSIFTLTTVIYKLVKSRHREAATQILPPSTLSERQTHLVRFFSTEKGNKYPNPLARIGILLGARTRLVNTESIHYNVQAYVCAMTLAHMEWPKLMVLASRR